MLRREQADDGAGDDKEFMATLAKGLAVLGCFGKQRPSMTLSEAPCRSTTIVSGPLKPGPKPSVSRS